MLYGLIYCYVYATRVYSCNKAVNRHSDIISFLFKEQNTRLKNDQGNLVLNLHSIRLLNKITRICQQIISNLGVSFLSLST